MTQVETIKFHKPIDQNDLSIVESVIYPIFSKKTRKEEHYWNEIRSLLLSAMKCFNVNSLKRNIFWLYVNRTITKGLKKGLPLIKVEETLRKFIRRHVDSEKDLKAEEFQYAKTRFEKVKQYVIGKKILDLGAGNGLLALEIKKQLDKEVILVDVVDYNYTDLPLILYNQEDKVPLANKEVDTTILYTVLHHASDPKHLLEEATRVTRQRLVIKEAYIEEDDIRITNSFVDWFYNRVIGDEDINVPLNFLKVEAWKQLLKSYGFEVIETNYVGIDEPAVPEQHVFIIAERTI
ncbi:MAG: methyltransferase domain-containing protein [Promethearchaeia archaeon]